MTNILITGVGSPGGPGIIKAIQSICPSIKVVGADADYFASGAFICNDFVKLPFAAENTFSSAVYDIVEKHEIEIVFPLVTGELEKLSKLKQEVNEKFNCRILVSDYETLKIANNKFSLMQHANELGLLIPTYFSADSFSELINYVNFFIKKNNKCVIKPVNGNGSRGVRIVHSDSASFEELVCGKPGSIRVPLSYLERLDIQELPSKYLITEFIDGPEITTDLVVNNGEIQICLMRFRSKMASGISTAGQFFFDDELYESLTKLVRSLDFQGAVGFQFIKNENGYYLIECNPRLQGSTMASMAYGVNIPAELYSLSVSGKCIRFNSDNSKKYFSRYYSEVFFDAL